MTTPVFTFHGTRRGLLETPCMAVQIDWGRQAIRTMEYAVLYAPDQQQHENFFRPGCRVDWCQRLHRFRVLTAKQGAFN